MYGFSIFLPDLAFIFISVFLTFYELRENRLPNLSLHDERSLLDAVANSDQKAFTRLVDAYWNNVYSHALAYTKSSPSAQEITQDVFLLIWNKRDKLKEVQNFKSYLFILGKNRILSTMRKKLMELTGKDPLDAPEVALAPDRKLEYKQVHEKIMEAIEAMPPVRRKVFTLSRLDGMSYEEIAKEMGISKNTVKEHIVRGGNFIRTYLHTHGGDLMTITLFSLLYS